MQVLATGDGATDSMALPQGDWLLEISASSWDGASATLQESLSGDAFADSDDPYNTGSALTRTANGKLCVVAGGCRVRLNVSSYGGSTAGLKLVANPSSR